MTREEFDIELKRALAIAQDHIVFETPDGKNIALYEGTFDSAWVIYQENGCIGIRANGE